MRSLSLIAAATLAARVASAVGTNDQVNPDLDYGSFQNPSSNVRPRFRYWVNDASMNLTVLAEDVRSIGKAGGGGIELLGYYLYGDSTNYGGGDMAPLQTDWSEYYFGSPPWGEMLDTILEVAKENDLIIDFANGPNQGAGVPTPYNDDGLLWDLAGYNSTFSSSSGFSGTIPGWGSGRLTAVTTGTIKSNTSSEVVLYESSLRDVTSMVGNDGSLTIDSSKTLSGSQTIIFAYYLVHSEYREAPDPTSPSIATAVPQSPVTTYNQNGSWVVDHFSPAGAQVVASYWKEAILTSKIGELVREVGNYLWEDSQEYSVATFWTPDLQKKFLSNRGYSVNKYIPLLVGSGGGTTSDITYVTDENDSGDSHIVDYQQTLTELNAEYLDALTDWSNSLGVQFSAQVVYNLPMDMLSNVPHVNAPECETLGFSENIDGYRQFSGPANLAGKRIISSEAGAMYQAAYQESISELLWTFKRSFAGSVNNFIIHGFPNSGNYGNTTWPGFTTFAYLFSAMHGPRQPSFAFYSDFLNWVSRNQFVLQTGIPKVDIAFWSKSTTYKSISTIYDSTDLEDAGYTYEYLSPDNFALPEAFVSDKVFAPNRQAFKALVVRSNESLTTLGVEKLVDYAHAGLPIIFPGGLPSNFSGYNPTAAAKAVQDLKGIKSLKNVHLVSSDGLASTLESLNILPRSSTEVDGTWYTLWREDTANAKSYVYVYNDATGLSFDESKTSGTISFESTGVPFFYDAWSGEVTRITTYKQSKTHTTIPLELAGNQSIIVGFDRNAKSTVHIEETTTPVLPTANSSQSLTVLRTYDSESRDINLSNGKTVSLSPMSTGSFTLSNWNLTIESWTPLPDLYDTEGQSRNNQTFQISSLIPWNQISSSLRNVSGIGYYETRFNWSPSSSSKVSGAFIDLGPITHTARVIVNGQELPPLDITWARRDIGQFLQKGENTLQVTVSTTLGNGLRTYWDVLETSGKLATAEEPDPPSEADYGLIYPVKIAPYRKDKVA
ncbi:secreted protein [Penicillium malachiteum]|uniref:Secreted protein n=1 Tax=Penicillium malachiteum TaxID=1324776 RepID=A0AAD6HGM3_9EURO|nr:secreted protein [Penicillium malachiteum]